MIVLDASVVLEWLLGLPRAGDVEQRLLDRDRSLHAPHLLSVEVTQVVRRYESHGEISADRAVAAIADLADLDIARYDHEPLLPSMWQLRGNLTAYDATYVALALALDAPLLTMDARLAGAPHDARVELIA